MADKKIQFEKECPASWQIQSFGGTMFRIHCRNCGTILSTGGTPKCLHPKFREDKIAFTRRKRDTLSEFIKNLFKHD